MHPRAGNCSCLGSISPSPGVKSSALFLPTPQTRRSLSGRSPSLCVILAERARDRPSPRPPRKTTGRSGKGKNGRCVMGKWLGPMGGSACLGVFRVQRTAHDITVAKP
ncbi:hypothetical protein SETIT_5G133400v2 [Setaria italica]|uniref:Uncharacterized protein n=1 Tax=Setaria italica TaxID=4555 RepID=A0A368R4A0_SETIT|nr:hypothetical protein SETIT_5G133400v2 [Setaria italica]